MQDNFGSMSNGMVCGCGKHEGVGQFPNGNKLSAADRAARYSRMKKLGISLDSGQFEYLKSWESTHGIIAYTMEVVGISEGSDPRNGIKGYLPRGQSVVNPVATSGSDNTPRNWYS